MRHLIFGFERLECIMFTYQQYMDLIRFCTSNRSFSIINIDTTFKLGKFYVTYLTYKNLTLRNRENNENPTFFGPFMVHLHKDKSAFLNFANKIKEFDLLNKNKLSQIQCFITDDDPGLHSAFQTVFPDSQFMLCRNHLKKDFQKVLGQFSVPDDARDELINEIFGSNGKREESLIGSENAQEFEERSNLILEKLTIYERKYKTKIKSLDEWFYEYMLKKIYNNHSKIKWTHDTNINNYYTTNDIESKSTLIEN